MNLDSSRFLVPQFQNPISNFTRLEMASEENNELRISQAVVSESFELQKSSVRAFI